MIDFDSLSDEEVLQLRKDVTSYIHNKRIPEPDFYLHESIQVEEFSYINPETLIPTMEIKIMINKEDIQRFRQEWEPFYQKEKDFYRNHRGMSPDKEVTLKIKHQIEECLRQHLDKNYPTVHYG